MKKYLNQQGIAHILFIVIAVVVVVAGGAGYYVYNKQKDKNPAANTSPEVTAAIEAACKTVDEDVCKFMTSWKEQDYYTIVSTSTNAGVSSTMTMKLQGDNYHMITDGDSQYEAIKIGDTTYIKDFSDNTWWKHTSDSTEDSATSSSLSNSDLTFEESSEATPEALRIVYKKIGKEACGDLTCFKYQILDPSDTATTSYIWFDDKDYQLRRMETTSADGTYGGTFDYTAFTITEPSPTKEYNLDQYQAPTE